MDIMIRSKVVYCILALTLGVLGIHDFYAGYAGRGVWKLIIAVGLGWLIIPLIPLYIWVLYDICTTYQDKEGKLFE